MFRVAPLSVGSFFSPPDINNYSRNLEKVNPYFEEYCIQSAGRAKKLACANLIKINHMFGFGAVDLFNCAIIIRAANQIVADRALYNIIE